MTIADISHESRPQDALVRLPGDNPAGSLANGERRCLFNLAGTIRVITVLVTTPTRRTRTVQLSFTLSCLAMMRHAGREETDQTSLLRIKRIHQSDR